jgi:hypothetical protein
VGSFALAAVVLIALGWPWIRPEQPIRHANPPPQVADLEQQVRSTTTVVYRVDPADELNRLEADLDALASGLADISGESQRLEAERQIDRLLAHYGQWNFGPSAQAN